MEFQPAPRTISLARFSVMAMLFAAPIPFGAVYPWAWAALTVLTLLVVGLWAAGSVEQRVLRIDLPLMYAPVVLLLPVGLLQIAVHSSFTPIETKESLLKLTTYVILTFVVIQLFASAHVTTWRRVGIAVLVFGFVVSVLSVLQFFWNPVRILWVGHDLATPFGPYVDRDHYAGLMEMVIPLSASFVLSRPKRDPRNGLLWFAVLIPVVSVLLTGSRGGFVALLVETSIMGWILIWRSPRQERRAIVATTGLVLIGVAAIFFWLVPGIILSKLGSARNYVPDRSGGRLVLWRGALGIILDHPLMGTGMGSFVTAYPAYQRDAQDLVVEHAHNDYLEALTETGVLGGVLILAALIAFIRHTFTNLAVRLKREARWIQLGAAIACCGLLIHSFADFNLHIPANAAWFAFCAGLASLFGQANLAQVR
jgi:O-antigen ligase